MVTPRFTEAGSNLVILFSECSDEGGEEDGEKVEEDQHKDKKAKVAHFKAVCMSCFLARIPKRAD